MCYTDGITEATSASVEAFGEARLKQVLYGHRRASAGDIAAALENALRAFVGGAPQFDDTTSVAFAFA